MSARDPIGRSRPAVSAAGRARLDDIVLLMLARARRQGGPPLTAHTLAVHVRAHAQAQARGHAGLPGAYWRASEARRVALVRGACVRLARKGLVTVYIARSEPCTYALA